MEFLTSAILGGLVWDGMKETGKLTLEYLKHSLQQWKLKDSDCEKIVEIINESPKEYKKTEKFVTAFIDDNKEICKIIDDVNSSKSNNKVITQDIKEN